MELYDLNPARNKCPFPAEAPPLRGSGADAFTASSSSMVYVVGLLGPAFPAFGPQVGCPDTDIGPTWPTCPTPLVPRIAPASYIPEWNKRDPLPQSFLFYWSLPVRHVFFGCPFEWEHMNYIWELNQSIHQIIHVTQQHACRIFTDLMHLPIQLLEYVVIFSQPIDYLTKFYHWLWGTAELHRTFPAERGAHGCASQLVLFDIHGKYPVPNENNYHKKSNQMYSLHSIYIYICMYVCMHGWMDGWMDGCMYVYIYKYVCNVCMYIRIYIYIYIYVII